MHDVGFVRKLLQFWLINFISIVIPPMTGKPNRLWNLPCPLRGKHKGLQLRPPLCLSRRILHLLNGRPPFLPIMTQLYPPSMLMVPLIHTSYSRNPGYHPRQRIVVSDTAPLTHPISQASLHRANTSLSCLLRIPPMTMWWIRFLVTSFHLLAQSPCSGVNLPLSHWRCCHLGFRWVCYRIGTII